MDKLNDILEAKRQLSNSKIYQLLTTDPRKRNNSYRTRLNNLYAQV